MTLKVLFITTKMTSVARILKITPPNVDLGLLGSCMDLVIE